MLSLLVSVTVGRHIFLPIEQFESAYSGVGLSEK